MSSYYKASEVRPARGGTVSVRCGEEKWTKSRAAALAFAKATAIRLKQTVTIHDSTGKIINRCEPTGE